MVDAPRLSTLNLLRCKLAGLVFQHDRDIIPYRVGQPAGAADQFFILRVIDQRSFTNRAYDDFKKFFVQWASPATRLIDEYRMPVPDWHLPGDTNGVIQQSHGILLHPFPS